MQTSTSPNHEEISAEERADFTFHVRINGGPEQTLRVRTGIYVHAVAALPALLGIDIPADVEIWVPHLMPEYGPYFYRIERGEALGFEVRALIHQTEKEG